MGSSQKPKYIGVRTKIAMVIVFVVLAATAADLIWNQVFYQNVAQSQALEKAELLTQEMEKAATLLVPLEAECHIGSDWYEAK